MKKLIFLGVAMALLGCSNKSNHSTSKFVIDYTSKTNIQETTKHIVNSLKDKNYKLITTYNHEKDALALKKMLYPTVTLVINNPKISTKLLTCNPTMAQDLPLRIAIYNTIKGKTYISYTDPEYWSIKHNIKDAECINLIVAIKQDLAIAVDGITVEEK